jgi:hypothetical protein
MEKVLVRGSAGFIGGYLVEELLRRAYAVLGLDNLSKYGKVKRSYDGHHRYQLVEGDARDVDLMTRLLTDCDHFIAGAAMIGGIPYFHTYAYDLLATNERIIAASCHAAIAARKQAACGESPISPPQWSSKVLLSGLPTRVSSARCHRRCRHTVSRSWQSSTLHMRPGISTRSPTR